MATHEHVSYYRGHTIIIYSLTGTTYTSSFPRRVYIPITNRKSNFNVDKVHPDDTKYYYTKYREMISSTKIDLKSHEYIMDFLKKHKYKMYPID